MNKICILFLALASSICCQGQVEVPAKLSDRPELIINHTGYTLSYNYARGTPNWSAWVLTRSHVNNSTFVGRTDVFYPDPCVSTAYRVQPSDYTGSGYDRGHMCPAADMAYSKQAMHDCFYMSNMCPQAPTLNRVSWKTLESACRKWVLTEDTLYIVCGPVYSVRSDSTGSLQATQDKRSPPYKQIGISHKVLAPDGFFKVILSLRKGHAKAIGFYYTNDSTKQSIQATATSVDAIEQLTGIDFFYTLDDSLEEQLESKCNLKDWK